MATKSLDREEIGKRTDPRVRPVREAFLLVRQQPLVVLLVSVAVLTPCLWQTKIQAGDLGSHVYNAWLVQLVERGQAPGLWIAHQWNNVLFDLVLVRLGDLFGLGIAQKLAVCAAVLIFVWGAIALIFTVSGCRSWSIVPVVAMLAYGWTFNMGFLNFYISLGLSFFALALVWRGRRPWDYVLAVSLVPLMWLAHPMGVLWFVSAAAYVGLAKWMPPRRHFFLMLLGVAAAIAIRVYIARHFPVVWRNDWLHVNGADQLLVYGRRYIFVSAALLDFSIVFLFIDYKRHRNRSDKRMITVPVQMYLLVVYGLALMPEAIFVSRWAVPASFIVERLTLVAAVLGCCILASMRPRTLYMAIFISLALAYFTFLYQDTRKLNEMESQIENLVANLPYGTRVVCSLQSPPGSRIFIHHIVDRACVGHCFNFGNYEASSLQFRLRARPGNGIVTANPQDADAIWGGKYVVKQRDLPMYQIYECAPDRSQFCIRALHAEETNGQIP